MPILLLFNCIFAVGNSSKQQLIYYFMDINDFIKGRFELTITNVTNEINLFCPYDANHLFFSVIDALMAGNDVHIYFDKNPYNIVEHEACTVESKFGLKIV